MSREAKPLSDDQTPGRRAEFTLLTINLLSGAARWELRRELILAQLHELAPDVIAVQEVGPPTSGIDSANWLASRLGYPHVHLCWQPPGGLGIEAVGLISRLPLERCECLRLNGQQRVAQRVQIDVGGQAVWVANTHLSWQPGDSAERLRQADQLLGWLKTLSGNQACVIAGDFNSAPETRAIRKIAAVYPSAYATLHGHEPDYTFPTPLKRPRLEMLKGVLRLLPYLRPQPFRLRLKNTLDYIFVDPRLHVAGCRLVLDQPDANDPGLYPSDHFGLMANILTDFT
jgi:endonuclease/exonuclease/phosphatase family metal-dependent hydrolase